MNGLFHSWSGWNRQFKWLPCSKRHPFCYHLPFVDDFSVSATVHAQETRKIPRRSLRPGHGTPDKDEFMHNVAEKRKRSELMSRAHKKQKLFPHYPQHNKTRAEKATDIAFGVGLAAAGWLGGAFYLESIGGPGYIASRFRAFERSHPYLKYD